MPLAEIHNVEFEKHLEVFLSVSQYCFVFSLSDSLVTFSSFLCVCLLVPQSLSLSLSLSLTVPLSLSLTHTQSSPLSNTYTPSLSCFLSLSILPV
jgi:hypothetical protein